MRRFELSSLDFWEVIEARLEFSISMFLLMEKSQMGPDNLVYTRVLVLISFSSMYNSHHKPKILIWEDFENFWQKNFWLTDLVQIRFRPSLGRLFICCVGLLGDLVRWVIINHWCCPDRGFITQMLVADRCLKDAQLSPSLTENVVLEMTWRSADVSMNLKSYLEPSFVSLNTISFIKSIIPSSSSTFPSRVFDLICSFS